MRDIWLTVLLTSKGQMNLIESELYITHTCSSSRCPSHEVVHDKMADEIEPRLVCGVVARILLRKHSLGTLEA